jgi:hypothetical protein
VDNAFILADQILQLIRTAGVSKIEAHAALSAAQTVLSSLSDISYDHQPEDSESALAIE